ncbi:MAG: TlpA disulfide reductase family protein [Pirellulales bacterium]
MSRFVARFCTAFLAVAWFCSQTSTATALDVGDPAPKLAGKFIQGEPVQQFAGDKIYIVEFWATWCGPCKAAIPHLNELHNKYKDRGIVVIGQNVWEHDLELPEPFVKEMGEKMSYRVALDDLSEEEKGTMAKTWMTAAGRNGIPSSFVVGRDGKISFIGHPSELTEEMMDQLLAGTFDPAAAKAKQLAELKEREKRGEVSRAIFAAIAKKEFETAESKITELEEMLPETQRYQSGTYRVDLAMAKGDHTAAVATANELAAKYPQNAALLFMMSQRLRARRLPRRNC